MGLWGGVTGVLDHAAGSIDESIGRQFDNQEGGGFGDQIADLPFNRAEGDDFVVRGAPKRAVDFLFDYKDIPNYHDTIDVAGPTVGGVADAVTQVEGEEHGSEEMKAKLLIYGVVALVVLYLLAPIFELGAALAGDE